MAILRARIFRLSEFTDCPGPTTNFDRFVDRSELIELAVDFDFQAGGAVMGSSSVKFVRYAL